MKLVGKVTKDGTHLRLYFEEEIGTKLKWGKKTARFGVGYTQRRASPQQCLVLAPSGSDDAIEPIYLDGKGLYRLDVPVEDSMKFEAGTEHHFRIMAGSAKFPMLILMAQRPNEKADD